MTKQPAPDEKPAHVRLRDLTGDDRPIAAFEFDWQSPSYGGRLASNDFTAIVVHEGGSSLAWHGQLLELDRGDVHVVPAGTAHRIYDFGKAAGVAVAFVPSALEAAHELVAALRTIPNPCRVDDPALDRRRRRRGWLERRDALHPHVLARGGPHAERVPPRGDSAP